jgi:phosphatidate cytidylyltransferase
VAAALLFAPIFLADFNWLFLGISAVLLTAAGIAGDLTESIAKRGMGVKDSGHCLGGHGGILDRIDSLLFAGPVLFYLLFLAR